MKLKNFKPYYGEEGDYDYEPSETTVVREFTGRITKKRYKIIMAYARKLTDTAPYGYSPNGYRYSCGHEYDCCGCLVSEHGHAQFAKHWKGNKVKVFYTQYRNY
jgi:hypothetical protein